MNIRKSSTILLVVLFSLSLIGCGSGGSDSGGISSTGIGSGGGIIEITGNKGEVLKLEIPEEALVIDTNISVLLIDDPNGIPSSDSLFPKVILGPEGTVFEKPIYLTFQITDEILQNTGVSSLDEAADYLNIYYWDEGSQLWEPLTIFDIDSANNTVVAEINHFSQYQLVLDWYRISRVEILTIVRQGEDFRIRVTGDSRSFSWVDYINVALLARFPSFMEEKLAQVVFSSDSETSQEFIFTAPSQEDAGSLVINDSAGRILWKQEIIVDYETDVFRSDNYYINLINDYCPVLVFGKWDKSPWNQRFPNGEEIYFPTRIEDALEDAKLNTGRFAKIVVDNPSIDDLSEMGDSTFILSFDGESKIEAGREKLIYATAVDTNDYVYLQYWFYYHFDPKDRNAYQCWFDNCGFNLDLLEFLKCQYGCFKGDQLSLQFLSSHNGDFESIVVALKKNGLELEEECVVYGQHLPGHLMKYPELNLKWTNAGVKVPWGNAEKEGTHPYVYVALGSHGCYPREGVYTVNVFNKPGFFDYEEKAGGGIEWYPEDYAIEYLPRMSYLYLDSPQWESKKFLLFSGYWGNNYLVGPRLMTHNHKWFVVDWINGLEEVSFGEIEEPEPEPEPEPPASNPWPMFMRDSRHTGRSQFSGPSTGNVLWSIGVGDLYNPPIVGQDGTIYITEYKYSGITDLLSAYNSAGNLEWRFDPEDISWLHGDGVDFKSSPAIGPDGTTYIMGHSQGVPGAGFFAINPNGTLKWVKEGVCLTDLTIGSDDTIYVGRASGIDAFYPNGNLKWSCACGRVEHHAPAISPDGVIYATAAYNLVAINSVGTENWRISFSGTILIAPAIGSDGTIYTGTYPNFYAVNPNGSIKWDYAANGDYDFASPAIDSDGTIYIGLNGYLHAINSDGSLKWKFDLPVIGSGFYPNTLCIDKDGVIYAATRDYLMAINSDGSVRWEYCDDYGYFRSPVIGAEGRLYVGHHLNELYAFGN